MKKSIQTICNKGDKEGQIALFVNCTKCNKGRVYMVDRTLKSLYTKDLSSFSIKVVCEKCKTIIYLGIGYTKKELRYPTTFPDFYGENGFEVSDDIGLKEMEVNDE